MPRAALHRLLPSVTILVCLWTPRAGRGEGERVFFGNLHSHTSYSDGTGTPSEAYVFARDVGKLSFLAITEHNHSLAEQGAGERKDGRLIATDPALYEDLKRAARTYTRDGVFVALYGQEFSTISSGNHMNVFEVPDVIDEARVPSGSFAPLFKDWIPRHHDSQGLPAILQLNHPWRPADPRNSREYGRDDLGSLERWRETVKPLVCTIEVLNGPGTRNATGVRAGGLAEGAFLAYLDQGLRLAPTADQDNHYRTWGTLTDARTAVVARELTKPALMDAIRQRHVYATEDRNLRVLITVNGRLCGDAVVPPPARGSELSIRYNLSDDDEPGALYRIEVWRGDARTALHKVVQVPAQGGSPSTGWKPLRGVLFLDPSDVIFFKIIQTSDLSHHDRAWTAPVWFTPHPGVRRAIASAPAAGAGAPATTASGPVAAFGSGVYHVGLTCRDARRIKPENLVRGEDATFGRRLHQNCPR